MAVGLAVLLGAVFYQIPSGGQFQIQIQVGMALLLDTCMRHGLSLGHP